MNARQHIPRIVLVLALLTFAVLGHAVGRRNGKPAASWQTDAYVWQRQWTPALASSVTDNGTAFRRLVILGAEISLNASRPKVAAAAIDWTLLRETERPVGIALRIGSYAGPFKNDDAVADLVIRVARGLVADARRANVEVAELQVDFDCATSKLAGYRVWMGALRPALDVPLTFTALPTWLRSPAFRSLAKTSDGYVLQVHSLERPATINDEITLCDPDAARAAVKKAGRIKVPFRVALPTYGYVLAFDESGRFGGISTDAHATAGAGAQRRDVRACVKAMADLFHGWKKVRPQSMQGVIWYRLPSTDDGMNWHWKTLAAILDGRVPQADLHGTAQPAGRNLWEISVENRGEAEAQLPRYLDVTWPRGKWMAADGLGSYEGRGSGGTKFRFARTGPTTHVVLRPDESRAVGWIRLSEATEVSINASTIDL